MKLFSLCTLYLLATTPPHKKISKREEKWDSQILPSLLRYKAKYDDLLVPGSYIDPVTNIKLGSLVESIRNKGTWKQKHKELLGLGFEFNSTDEVKWQRAIKPAFERYIEIHGDCLVPQNFVVPSCDLWPGKSHGLKLGKVTMAIRAKQAWKTKRPELERMGFVFVSIDDIRWDSQLYPALHRYKELHQDLQVPVDFVIPYSEDYPPSTHGIKLGLLVKSIRNRGDYKSKRQQLEALGFEYQSQTNSRWEKKILPALFMYQQVHGDLLVPAQFVVPRNSPWPKSAYDLRLGSIVNHIRNNGLWESKHEQLERMGFQFGDYLESVWTREIFPAFVSFKNIYGHLKVPRDFVVPSESPWPEDSYDIQLGEVLRVIYDQGVWKEKLIRLGELAPLEIIEGTFKDWISGIKVSEEFYSDATFMRDDNGDGG